jgi:hypothetical protein
MTRAVTGYPIPIRGQVEASLITALLSDAVLVEDDEEYPRFYSPETVWPFPIRLLRYVQ